MRETQKVMSQEQVTHWMVNARRPCQHYGLKRSYCSFFGGVVVVVVMKIVCDRRYFLVCLCGRTRVHRKWR